MQARSSRPDVRALARDALSVQADRFAAMSAVLLGWGRPEKASPPIGGPGALDGLDGEALDQMFVDRLTAHTHASLIRSRAEMVAGASRSTRSLAEDAIHADDRQLAALQVCSSSWRSTGRRPGRPGLDVAMERRRRVVAGLRR